jgi:Na+/proline symporter
MGSLSTALNALATSFSRDFIIPRMRMDRTEGARVRVLRWSTLFFALLIIVVGIATAWYVSYNPAVRIIPLVLGVIGYTFGSLLGVFLVGVFTRTRGNDFGNITAMIMGFLVVGYLSGVDLMLIDTFLPLSSGVRKRDLIIAFPWRVTFGCIVTTLVAMLFPSRKGLRRPIRWR